MKYLLYIDILGFAEMMKSNPEKIRKLFSAIDRLNVHRHNAFKTIIFSDTILVFNAVELVSEHDHEYTVMFACEFTQDLLFWCIKLEIQFRAILVYGDFIYSKMDNFDGYFGSALIEAYQKEKNIIGMGLFIDNKIPLRNDIFKRVRFDVNLDFVFLTQNLEFLRSMLGSQIPLPRQLFENEGMFPYLRTEVAYLNILRKNINSQIDSKIRAKYLQTYHLYKMRYPEIIKKLEIADFDIAIFNNEIDWDVVSIDNWNILE